MAPPPAGLGRRSADDLADRQHGDRVRFVSSSWESPATLPRIWGSIIALAIMAATAEVQDLLRFLTKDARIPLVEAMPKINALRKLNLSRPEQIAHAPQADLKTVFTDEKVLKTTVNAAKRVSNPKKKETASSRSSKSSRNTRQDASDDNALRLPETTLTEHELTNITIETNRAPLYLAFVIAVLKYTHSEQPISSRLSLAQGVVGTGAASRAKHLGITNGPTAEEDGFGQGQPKVNIMGREIAVMRRQHTTEDTNSTADGNPTPTSHEALWAIDLEAMRKAEGPLIGSKSGSNTGPPIHTPQSARNYLLRAMNIVTTSDEQPPKPKKPSAAEVAARKEEAAAMVLQAIDIVLSSWRDTLDDIELDRRAQSWYAMVRPEIASGREGWGQRGHVPLSEILKLKR
jgi:hypothetical protein